MWSTIPLQQGEPNGGTHENCAAFNTGINSYSGQWYDENCSHTKHFICEKNLWRKSFQFISKLRISISISKTPGGGKHIIGWLTDSMTLLLDSFPKQCFGNILNCPLICVLQFNGSWDMYDIYFVTLHLVFTTIFCVRGLSQFYVIDLVLNKLLIVEIELQCKGKVDDETG